MGNSYHHDRLKEPDPKYDALARADLLETENKMLREAVNNLEIDLAEADEALRHRLLDAEAWTAKLEAKNKRLREALTVIDQIAGLFRVDNPTWLKVKVITCAALSDKGGEDE